MLGKLFKYEMKAMGRIMLPFYAALLAVAALFSVSLAVNGNQFEGRIGVAVNVFLVVALVGLFIASGVVCLVLIIQRYYKNLLGDEGYLMFTLPVKTGEHIACKTISAALWVFAGILAGLVAGMIILLGAIGWKEFAESCEICGSGLADLGLAQVSLLAVELLLLVLTSAASSIAMIYTAISIGHQWAQHRILGAILAYIGINTVLSTAMTVMGLFVPLLRLEDWLSGWMNSMTGVHLFFWGVILIDLVTATVFSLISWFMLDRHLNLQ